MSGNREAQLANCVLMIRPGRFESNPMTAASTHVQGRSGLSADQQQWRAAREFDELRQTLVSNGVRVITFDDTPEPHTPDAVFPNNWVSFHADGTVVIYPMAAANRRTERRIDIVDALASQHGFRIARVLDLTGHEDSGRFLEGTGSMVLDREHRVAYACLSPRTQSDALGDFAQHMHYDVLAFEAADQAGNAIYHTNVLMNIGDTFAVICPAAIRDDKQRLAVTRRLETTGHALIELGFAELHAFAGNMLALRSASDEVLLVMSEQARQALTVDQVTALEKHARIVSVAIDTIEASAGGSVRCMLAEVQLPPAASG